MVVTINTSWLKSQSGNSYGENTIVFPHSGIFLRYSPVSGRDNFSQYNPWAIEISNFQNMEIF